MLALVPLLLFGKQLERELQYLHGEEVGQEEKVKFRFDTRSSVLLAPGP